MVEYILQLDQEPFVDLCQFKDLVHRISLFKCIGYDKYPHIGRLGKVLFNVVEFQVAVPGEAVHALTDHPNPFLYGLLKCPSDRHYFPDTLHGAVDQFAHPGEFVQVPAGDLANNIVQRGFKKS